MDGGVCLPEKPDRIVNNGDGLVSQVKFIEVNQSFDCKHWPQAVGLLYSAWKKINGVDLSEWVDVDLGHDIKIPMQSAESMLYWYVKDGCEIRLALDNDEAVGLLIYRRIFSYGLEIRIMYLDEQKRLGHLAAKMIDEMPFKVKKIVFQTNKKLPPKRMLELSEKYRNYLWEDDNYITWEMNWRA